MESSTQEKYLGDVIDKSGKSKINIEKKKIYRLWNNFKYPGNNK